MPTCALPRVLPLRERASRLRQVLADRLDTVLPRAMQEADIDLWLVLCQEDDYDPVFRTLMPFDTWCPILQILLFHRQADGRVERLSLSMTDTGGLYPKPWNGQREEEQWPLLRRLVEERRPKRIGINTGHVQWAAGGLTHNLYVQLVNALGPELAARLMSAEPLATRWLAELTETEITLFDHVVRVAHGLLAECFSRQTIVPGLTTLDDLEWHYWQRAADLGLDMAFKPFFMVQRVGQELTGHGHKPADRTIRPGDLLRSDVGIRYLGLNSDHQQAAYVLRPGETAAPAGWRHFMTEVNHLQDIYLAEFEHGLTGNEMLARILARARLEGVPNPRVYSHSLGHLLHEPGPLIGLPWEQVACRGRGEVRLDWNYAFTVELGVGGPLPEWGGQEVRLGLEEDAVFTRSGCRLIDGRQQEFHLV